MLIGSEKEYVLIIQCGEKKYIVITCITGKSIFEEN
jgi:hypothetical protein